MKRNAKRTVLGLLTLKWLRRRRDGGHPNSRGR